MVSEAVSFSLFVLRHLQCNLCPFHRLHIEPRCYCHSHSLNMSKYVFFFFFVLTSGLVFCSGSPFLGAGVGLRCRGLAVVWQGWVCWRWRREELDFLLINTGLFSDIGTLILKWGSDVLRIVRHVSLVQPKPLIEMSC